MSEEQKTNAQIAQESTEQLQREFVNDSVNICTEPVLTAQENADNIARHKYYRAIENRRAAMTLAVDFMKDQSGIGPNEVCQVAFIFEGYLNDIQVPDVAYI